MGAAANSPPVSPSWSVPPAPSDPILALYQAYLRDPDPHATNLSVGAYHAADGTPHVFRAIAAAAASAAPNPSRSYLPISGLPALRDAALPLIYGPSPSIHARTALLHTVSGSCALRLALSFCARVLHARVALVANRAWPNHAHLAAAEALKVSRYIYYSPSTHSLDFPALLADLRTAPPQAVLLLQPCAHNPTGCDLTPTQWCAVADLVQSRALIPIFDMAYQGLSSGDIHADAHPVRMFVQRGINVIVAQSFSKNLGLYNSRVGTVSVCLAPAPETAQVARNIFGQLCWLARATYSSPPAEGARLAATVLTEPRLRAEWETELSEMVARMRTMRSRLREELERGGGERKWAFVEEGNGMFVILGLDEGMVDRLRERHHVYVTRDSRINVAGLTEKNVGRVAESVREVIAHAKFEAESSRVKDVHQ